MRKPLHALAGIVLAAAVIGPGAAAQAADPVPPGCGTVVVTDIEQLADVLQTGAGVTPTIQADGLHLKSPGGTDDRSIAYLKYGGKLADIVTQGKPYVSAEMTSRGKWIPQAILMGDLKSNSDTYGGFYVDSSMIQEENTYDPATGKATYPRFVSYKDYGPDPAGMPKKGKVWEAGADEEGAFAFGLSGAGQLDVLATDLGAQTVGYVGLGLTDTTEGDVTVKSLTVGCTTWIFALDSKPIPACKTTTDGPRATSANSQGWEFTDERKAGHHEYTDDGLHVWTDDTSGEAKSAAYLTLPTPIPLAEIGEPNMELAAGGTGVRPGMQLGLVVDGTPVGAYLVGEPASYAGGEWWSTATLIPGRAGKGYKFLGTLDELNTYYSLLGKTVTVNEIGFSLGSGVKGDWTIESITAGCTKYAFGNAEATPAQIEPVAATCSDLDPKHAVPTTAGVDYYVDGQKVTGTFTVPFGKSADVLAKAQPGFYLPGKVAELKLDPVEPTLSTATTCAAKIVLLSSTPPTATGATDGQVRFSVTSTSKLTQVYQVLVNGKLLDTITLEPGATYTHTASGLAEGKGTIEVVPVSGSVYAEVHPAVSIDFELVVGAQPTTPVPSSSEPVPTVVPTTEGPSVEPSSEPTAPQPSPAPTGKLPVTGSEVALIVLVAALSLLGGGSVLWFRRRAHGKA